MTNSVNLASFRNQVLASLPDRERALVTPQLKLARLVAGQHLHEADQPITDVFFIESGVASANAQTNHGDETIEVALIGYDCLVGAQVVLGNGVTSFFAVTMLIPGEAYRMDADDLRQSLTGAPMLKSLISNRFAVFIASVAQTAACNSQHKLENRLARWLLMAIDLTKNDEIAITQDTLASLIGVGRPSLTLAMLALEKSGFIQHRRSRTTIVDRAGLETIACPCYRRLREYAVRKRISRAAYQESSAAKLSS